MALKHFVLYKKRNERGFIHRATRIECTALSKPLQTRGKSARAVKCTRARLPLRVARFLEFTKWIIFALKQFLIEAQNELSFELILSEFEVVWSLETLGNASKKQDDLWVRKTFRTLLQAKNQIGPYRYETPPVMAYNWPIRDRPIQSKDAQFFPLKSILSPWRLWSHLGYYIFGIVWLLFWT